MEEGKVAGLGRSADAGIETASWAAEAIDAEQKRERIEHRIVECSVAFSSGGRKIEVYKL